MFFTKLTVHEVTLIFLVVQFDKLGIVCKLKQHKLSHYIILDRLDLSSSVLLLETKMGRAVDRS